MSNHPTTIGSPPWSYSDFIGELEEFAKIYSRRPIKDNSGGMNSAQMFYAWFVAKRLQPSHIIESGVWYGQGTWFFEQAAPDAQLHCIDPEPFYRRGGYISTRAHYHYDDFSTIGWDDLDIDKQKTLCFFDDHQNAVQRISVCAAAGFKHLMFEDNYPLGEGDCYSLKQALHNNNSTEIEPGINDAQRIKSISDVYYEFPPIMSRSQNRWGMPWSTYETHSPVLTAVREPYQKIFFQEAHGYTWINYVQLKAALQ